MRRAAAACNGSSYLDRSTLSLLLRHIENCRIDVFIQVYFLVGDGQGIHRQYDLLAEVNDISVIQFTIVGKIHRRLQVLALCADRAGGLVDVVGLHIYEESDGLAGGSGELYLVVCSIFSKQLDLAALGGVVIQRST